MKRYSAFLIMCCIMFSISASGFCQEYENSPQQNIPQMNVKNLQKLGSQDLREKYIQYKNKKQYDKALVVANVLVKKYPNNYRYQYYKGYAEYKLMHYSNALQSYTKSRELFMKQYKNNHSKKTLKTIESRIQQTQTKIKLTQEIKNLQKTELTKKTPVVLSQDLHQEILSLQQSREEKPIRNFTSKYLSQYYDSTTSSLKARHAKAVLIALLDLTPYGNNNGANQDFLSKVLKGMIKTTNTKKMIMLWTQKKKLPEFYKKVSDLINDKTIAEQLTSIETQYQGTDAANKARELRKIIK